MHIIKDVTDSTKLELFLEFLWEEFGYDFRNYSRSHVYRRIKNRMMMSAIMSFDEFRERLKVEPALADMLLGDLSINVTEMFRDPDFYSALREQVLPALKTWSFIKIWHAGCSTGEEVYSTAILLKEEGLYDRATIYATDFNQSVLNTAAEGIYPGDRIKKYTHNYNLTSPKRSFSDYYHAKYDSVIMDNALKTNIIWANHNLVTDSDFSETHLILCRNVLIYFNRDLQNKVHQLFSNSLVNGGFLCLGTKESMDLSALKECYETIDKKNRIYKKRYLA